MLRVVLPAAIACILASNSAHAATLDGAAMPWPWALPFAGLLLTIAIGPLLFPKIWHDHYGKIVVLWSALALAPIATVYGVSTAITAFVHAVVAEYLSFIVLLFALYTVAGGIVVTGSLRGTPFVNTALLALGTGIASIVGTTGAAMILIRPVIRANARRRHRVHVIVFFIILVANIGGALTPLGDPPLFVGFLRGVDFFWTARHLWLQTAVLAAVVLGMFYVVDRWLSRGEPAQPAIPADPIQSRTDRPHHRRHIAVSGVEARRRVLDPRHNGRAAKPRARRRAHRHRARLAVADAGRAPRRERLHLGADPRSRQAFRRDLRHDRGGDRDAAGRTRR
jgi:hypothetical protein